MSTEPTTRERLFAEIMEQLEKCTRDAERVEIELEQYRRHFGPLPPYAAEDVPDGL